MNLPASKSSSASNHTVVSTYTILLLSGVLFGMCVSGNVSSDVKTWFVFAGTTGLLAYLGLRMVSRLHQQTQQRIAVMQVEERLDRHSHFDLHADDLRIDQPKVSAPRG
jgi:hypothetical protein